MQYTAWPDHGVPDDPKHFIEFIDEACIFIHFLVADAEKSTQSYVNRCKWYDVTEDACDRWLCSETYSPCS